MKKIYCDICNKEIIGDRRPPDSWKKAESALKLGNVDDICNSCLDILERQNIPLIVKTALLNVVCAVESAETQAGKE